MAPVCPSKSPLSSRTASLPGEEDCEKALEHGGEQGRIHGQAEAHGPGEAQHPMAILADSAFPYWADTEHFRLHYAASGADYLQVAATPPTSTRSPCALERSYACLRDTLDSQRPCGRRPGGRIGPKSVLRQSFDPTYIGSYDVDSCSGSGPCVHCSGYCFISATSGRGRRRGATALEYSGSSQNTPPSFSMRP